MTAGAAAVAVTAVSESLADGELEEARELALKIGIRHRVIHTEEFANPDYRRNNSDRCYFCKSELYGRLESMLIELGADVIASGANLDDMGDYRPGLSGRRTRGPAPFRSVSSQRPMFEPWRCLGASDMGQTRDSMPFKPDCLW